MSLPEVGSASYPTPSEVRDSVLRTLKFSFEQRGVSINVLPGSDYYYTAKAIADQVSIAIANNRIGLSDFSPLTAVGDKLEELAGVFGITRRPAASAAGYVTITCTGTITITSGFQCTTPDGKKYQTTSSNVGITTGAKVQLSAVVAGEDTNQDPGTIVTWDSASIGALAATATVDSGGLDGGSDADDDERLRDRLINRLAFPAEGGNWSQIKEWSEEASSSVEAAYVYPAARGASSYDVAVTSEGGDRTLTSTITSAVAAFVSGKMPGHASLNLTSVTANEVDVIINATLPLPLNAGGAGGGWIDASPYPSTADATLAKVTGTDVTLSQVTVNSTSSDAPTVGKHIGIWDPTNEVLLTFSIGAVSGSSGAYTLTLDRSVADVQIGAYVSAGATNLDQYATEFLAQVQNLGPGQKTTNADIIPRALRKPSPDVSHPSALTTIQLAAVATAHPEVLNLEYAARYDTGTGTTRTDAPVPSTAADPPTILVLKHLAFRRQA